VVRALRPNFVIARAWMAEEFDRVNDAATRQAFAEALDGFQVIREAHVDFKRRVPAATGLIRTGDSVQYANIILESG
jgi:D-ribose pyranase